MTITLPGGMVVHLDATYHRYKTASGNILVLPSPTTLFFMAMHPQESGLSGAQDMLGNGASILFALIGGSLTPAQLAQLAAKGYTDPRASSRRSSTVVRISGRSSTSIFSLS